MPCHAGTVRITQGRWHDQPGHFASDHVGLLVAENPLRSGIELHHRAGLVDRDDGVERGSQDSGFACEGNLELFSVGVSGLTRHVHAAVQPTDQYASANEGYQSQLIVDRAGPQIHHRFNEQRASHGAESGCHQARPEPAGPCRDRNGEQKKAERWVIPYPGRQPEPDGGDHDGRDDSENVGPG